MSIYWCSIANDICQSIEVLCSMAYDKCQVIDARCFIANGYLWMSQIWWLMIDFKLLMCDGCCTNTLMEGTRDEVKNIRKMLLVYMLSGDCDVGCEVCDVFVMCWRCVSMFPMVVYSHFCIHSSIHQLIDWLIDWLIDRSIDSWIQLATTTGTKAIRDLWWRGVVRGGRTGALDERRGFCGRTVFFVWAGATTATGLGCWCVFDVVCELGWRGLALDWVRLRSAATRCSDLPLASRSTSWRNWRSVVIIRFLPSDTTHRSRSRASKYLMTARLSCTSEVA